MFDTAVDLIGERGFDRTTLRDVADRAGVSVGLLYRYFPAKRAIVLALYEELSGEYARVSSAMPAGKWRDRFGFALDTSLSVLAPQRTTLKALAPVLVGADGEGLFAPGTAFSRVRVQAVFHTAVVDATDAPAAALAAAMGRMLYLAHLGVILWWLLDRSPGQQATKRLVALIRRVLPAAALTLRVPAIRSFVRSADTLFEEALLGHTPAADAQPSEPQ